ncbi:hypothetical protein HY994_01820 [Candidatus Micrarchaeota archaeon]|nr:hypothetical protein [Candidatus Micrarchaeota archaeon]
MRIGFLDCKTNSKDAWAIFSALADKQANIQAVHLTCPNPFKVPAACKRLFGQGVDTIIAAVTTESDNELEIGFLRDKVADVEIAEAKYVFLVIEDVHVRDEQVAESLQRALVQALEYLPADSGSSFSQSSSSSSGASGSGGMDMFSEAASGATGPAPGLGSGSSSSGKFEDEEANDFLDGQGGHKLF